MSNAPINFFTKEAAEHYDEKTGKLSSITGCMHFLISLILKDLPPDAKILCVGAGTGAEILFLAAKFPSWSFVAVEPSQAMLDVCRERVSKAGYMNRCEFVHGYVQDAPQEPQFHAVLSILVGHFVKREVRLDFYTSLVKRLVIGGCLVTTEISFDLDSKEFPSMLKHWEAVQTLMGATAESLATLPKQMKDVLTILPPTDVATLLRQSGLQKPVQFFQALMIGGWYGVKKQ